MAEKAQHTKDSDALTTAVRVALNRTIIENINGVEPEVPVITLAPELEQILQQSMQVDNGQGAGFEPGLAERLQQSLFEWAERQEMAGQAIILLVPPLLRKMLSRFARNGSSDLHVLSYQEVPDDKQVKIIGTVG